MATIVYRIEECLLERREETGCGGGYTLDAICTFRPSDARGN
jgi:hypothetical protein